MATKAATKKAVNGLDSESLDAIIKYMSSLVTMKDIVLAPSPKGFLLFASDSGAQVRVEMPPANVTLAEPVRVPLIVFQKAIAGRKNLSVKSAAGMLHLKAAGYSAELSTTECSEDLSITPNDEDNQEIQFSANAWNHLAAAAQSIQIETLPGMELNFFARVTKKTVMTAVYDTTQMAFQLAPAADLECEPFELSLPYDKISRILRGLPYDSTKLIISSGGVFVMTKRLRAFLPSVAVEASVSSEELQSKAKEIIALKGSAIQLDLAGLKAFLNNASSVSNGTAAGVTFKSDGDKVVAQAESSSGIVKNKLLGKCDKPFSIDLRFLQTMATKVKKDVLMTVTDSVAVTKAEEEDGTRLFYVTALQGDDSVVEEAAEDE